jgi:hypothetical protein
MSRYFFHIRDGEFLVPDEEGMECRNMRAVNDEARASARDIANAALHRQSVTIIATIAVEDELGNEVHCPAPKEWLH